MDCNYIMYFTPSDEKEGLPQTQAILCEYFFFFLVATRILTNFTRTSRTKWISFMKTHKSFIRMEQDYFFVLISQFTGKAREFRACLLFTWREKHWFMRELHFTCSITECSLKNFVKIIECHADWVNISY